MNRSRRIMVLFATSLALGGTACSRGAASPPPVPVATAVIPQSPAPSTPPVPTSAASLSDGDASATPVADPTAWIASAVLVDGLLTGEFAVAEPPDAEHPSGVLAVLASPPGAPYDMSIATIDVARASELGRVHVGLATEDDRESLGPWIASTPRGVVYASQGKKGLDLQWFDAGLRPGARRSLPGLGNDWHHRVHEVVGFDDRIVVVEAGRGDDTAVHVFDATGIPVTGHACPGSLGPPGSTVAHRVGDEVVLALHSEKGQPVCSFHLQGAPRWREKLLAWADTPPSSAIAPPCSGLTAMPWQEEPVGDRWVVRTVACCGDESPSGLFVCRPPAGR